MTKITLGQLTDKISQAVTRFEKEVMGRGPKQINTIINDDLIIIRLEGFFSQAEKRLAQEGEVEEVKKLRTLLFENEEKNFRKMIKEIIDVEIDSVHSDVSTRTGEKIIILTVKENLEKKYK